MTRNILNIGKYKFLIEHYDAKLDMKNNIYSSEYVMLRNFTLMNNITYDTDIYIIEKEYLELFIDEIKKSKSSDSKILVFPITDTNITNYSNTYKRFNNNFNEYSIYDIENNIIGDDVYELFGLEYDNILNKKKIVNKKIICDKIKIYHPLSKINIDAIIDISNTINGVKFHYLCRPYNTYKSYSDNEIKYNNEIYSEYIEVYFPNLDELFKINQDGTYNIYYKEDYNIVASIQNKNFINSIVIDNNNIEYSEYEDDIQIVPFNLFIQPFRIIEEYGINTDYESIDENEKIYVKLYLKINSSIDNNYFAYPINISLYPYDEIDEQNNIYILNSDLSQASISINNANNTFSIMSCLGFNEGIISIISLFNYPNKSYFYNLYKNDNTTSPLLEAYKYYYNVTDNDYHMFVNPDIQKEIDEIESVENIGDEMINIVKEVANVNYADKNEMLNVWKSIMKDTIIKEYEEEFGTPGNFIGFKIDIATDIQLKHIIFSKNVRVNFTDLDDFSFKLNGIFNNWNQHPDKLIVKIAFYDHILGNEITSNLVVITKEWFKYMINDKNVYRLTDLSYINLQKGKIDTDMKVIDLNENNVNFINNINCFINKHNNNSGIETLNKNQKIILKPIFYKVKDLQNIKLRNSLPQNIGINLSEYMSKVDVFKLIINSKEYIEIGRNDIFVIFNINPADIEGTSGKYDITNEDDTYLSSGNWIKV